MQEYLKLVVDYVIANWTWLVPWVFGLVSLIAILFKKGSITASDVAKITSAQKVIATALSVILEKEKKNNEQKENKSKEERKEVQ